MNLRPYQPGDEAAILDLYALSYPEPMPSEYWQWRYLANPVGSPMIELAWDEDGLAAHYAVSATALNVDGETLLTGLSMTTMTHPRQRGRGFFPVLAESLCERLVASGYSLVWGFPNAQSHRQFVASVSWTDISTIPVLAIDPHRLRLPAPGAKGTVHEMSQSGTWATRIWQRSFDRLGVCVRRDEAYLQWRVFEEPVQDYQVILYEEAGDALAYAIFKRYTPEIVNVVDIVGVSGADEAVAALIHYIVDHARAWDARSVTAWASPYHPTHGLFERMGFHLDAPITYLAGRPLVRDAATDRVLDHRQWRYTMIHSDVF